MNRKKSVRISRPMTESKTAIKGFNSSEPRLSLLPNSSNKSSTISGSPFSAQVKLTNSSIKRKRVPASFIRSDYVNNKGSYSLDRISFDRPEIIKDQAKKLVIELEKKSIILNDASIEKVIRGDPQEYLQIFKWLFTDHRGHTLRSLRSDDCPRRSCTDLVSKLDEKTNNGVVALFAILSQSLSIKPSLNPGQFLQKNRFIIQKLILCLEVTKRLSYHRGTFS